MAERVGFEPTVPRKWHDDLANRSFRPLRHLSDNLAGVQGIEPCPSGLESDVQPVTLYPYGAGKENRTPSIRLET